MNALNRQTELLDVKRELYAKLGPLAPEKTFFATNSSTLPERPRRGNGTARTVPLAALRERFVKNSLLVPFLEAAQALVVNGIADPETIDKTWRIATGAPKGPLQMPDIIGLTTAYHIAASGDEQARANARDLKEHYIDLGKLGRASGEGFYKYETGPHATVQKPGHSLCLRSQPCQRK
jgi:3-hydroxybutyryl-CoA dehydrogenase